MNTQAKAQSEPGPQLSIATRGRERRVYERFHIGAAYGTIVHNGNRDRCEVLDISLGGCRIRTEGSFPEGALAHVELTLPIDGMILRIQGITQWVTRSRQVGIRFVHPSLDSKNQLASLLTCLADQSVTEVVKAAIAAETATRPGAPTIALECPVDSSQKHENAVRQSERQENKEQAYPPPHSASPVHEIEPGTKKREKDDRPAVIRSIRDDHCLACAIVDLSLTGCCVRTPGPNFLGIHHRVEVAFHLLGLPFRMAGIIENTRDQHTIQVRFLQLSSRKQHELAQLIEELAEMERGDRE